MLAFQVRCPARSRQAALSAELPPRHTFIHRAPSKVSLSPATLACRASTPRRPAPLVIWQNRSCSMTFFPRDEYFMRLALREATLAPEHDDVPIGAVIVRGGEVIGAGHNEREVRNDPTGHAEMIALKEAARHLDGWRILDSVMYVTLEPCAMCAGAIVLARLPRVIYGAADPKAGAAGSVLNVLNVPQLNHRPQVQSGLLADESAQLLREFFALRRS